MPYTVVDGEEPEEREPGRDPEQAQPDQRVLGGGEVQETLQSSLHLFLLGSWANVPGADATGRRRSAPEYG
jgi:hypothetical protein